MTDHLAVAAAIAARYAPAQVTPPTGYRNIRLATHQPPEAMPPLPVVMVFPEAGELRAGNGTRLGTHQYKVRFYYDQAGDLARQSAALLAWLTVLADQHKAGVQLGGLVASCRTTAWRSGVMTYATRDYAGLEFDVEVVTSEPWEATA